jgi:5-formyltetrahydrofolate cyclo-ligase
MIDKESLRKELLRRRDSIPLEVRKSKNRSILERLLSLEEIKHAGLLLLFASFRSEVDTGDMATLLINEGKRVVFPKVDRERRCLLLYEVKALAELVPGYMGIPEPSVLTDERMVGINGIDLVIIPGAGFDAEGNRIGYGGGYYDRLLSSLTRDVPVVAPAYEEQIVGAVPAEPHDIRADMIVTDRRVVRCSPANPDNL